MKIEYAVICEKGINRAKNQDSYFVPSEQNNPQEKGWLYAVADGVGGYPAGDVASRDCCKMLSRDYYSCAEIESIPHWLNDEIIKINKAVVLKGETNDDMSNMATTLVSLLIKDDMAYLNNVGDSRIYKFMNDQLSQITEDHSVVWEFYVRNIITKDEIIDSYNKNLITEAIGLNRYPRINSYFMALPADFIFLLCSDGLCDVTTDVQMEKIIRQNGNDLQKCCEKLYRAALENGTRDDVTILLVKSKPESE
ncbi:MAG TPA: protein phosphatase 2C domain-containing protein [Candidatus Cloacimonadota bacterium]|nr:protein phosphatase 2C domain-containing protein [Candidatus Cloacimonadota bacterium]